MIPVSAPWSFRYLDQPIKRILLIDDDEIFNFVTKRIISRVDPEIIVSSFEKPEAGYKNLAEVNPDLILLDLNMPHLDGWTFLERMRNDGFDFPVIVLTSSILKEDKSKAREFMNVFGYISKPIEVKHLNIILEGEAAV